MGNEIPNTNFWPQFITGTGGSGGVNIEDNGIPVAGNPTSNLNFADPSVTATNLAGVTTVKILPALAGVNGAVLFEQEPGGTLVFQQLTQDNILPGFAITSFSPGFGTLLEVGQNLVNPSFTASYNNLPVSAQIADGINAALVLTTPFTAGTEPHTYTQSTNNATVTFTLTAVGGSTKTANVGTAWQPLVYFGIQTPGTLNAAFITTLPSDQLQPSFANTYAIGAGGNTKRAYLAYPASYGTPSSFKDANTGFAVPMSVVATVSVTNTQTNPVTQNYTLYASDNLLNAAFNLAVS